MEGADDVTELRRRLDMAEDELTFLKAVFEEYKDSSGELEAELDAQLKDLERSNMALKRENEQIRAQLQSTVTRSRKSAEEASNLTTALEAHLEELTKREKKAQSRIKVLEQENESLKTQVASGGGGGGGGGASSAQMEQVRKELDKISAQRGELEAKLGGVQEGIYNARMRATKLLTLTEHRYAVGDVSEREVPSLPDESQNSIEAITADLRVLNEHLGGAEKLLAETGLSTILVSQVKEFLQDHDKAHGSKLNGDSEQAINSSCMIILGKIMVLAESLPEFKGAILKLKGDLKTSSGEANKTSLAHRILTLADDIMKSVFSPMETKATEEELEKVKADAYNKLEAYRQESEKEMEALRKKQSSADLSLEAARKEMERLKAETEKELQSARTEAKQAAEQARREALKEAAVQRKDIEDEIYQSVAAEMDALREALEKSEALYKQATMKSNMYQESMKKAIVEQAGNMMRAMKNTRDELENLKRSTQRELGETSADIKSKLDHVRKVARTIAKSDVAQLSMMYERELDMRVKLQDQVQALRGNIRVFCRIRPLLGPEIENGETEAVQQTDEMTVTAEDPDAPGKPNSFNFDRVFGPEDTQEIVFDEMRTLCLSAMDGYNVCLFAYGITGSGKTFTVEGGDDSRDDPKKQGLVFRTMKEIFRIAYGERAGAYETTIKLQLLELYNEDFRDLLNEQEKVAKPEIRLIPDIGVKVDNVVQIPVAKFSEAQEVVSRGYRNRTVRATNSNSVSSRSHSILTFHLSGENLRTKKKYDGKLHFVDLAGSERVGKSGVQGDALKEAQAINKSLSALGDVIQALSKKESFVPFRNSQLTKLLQESLGGNSKTVMICNIAPCKHSMSETINSLRFATRAHSVEMGKAQKNESSADPAEVKQIKNKLADLENKFKSRGAGGAAPAAPAAAAGAGAGARGRGASTGGDALKAPTSARGAKPKEKSPRAGAAPAAAPARRK